MLTLLTSPAARYIELTLTLIKQLTYLGSSDSPIPTFLGIPRDIPLALLLRAAGRAQAPGNVRSCNQSLCWERGNPNDRTNGRSQM